MLGLSWARIDLMVPGKAVPGSSEIKLPLLRQTECQKGLLEV